MMRIGKIRYRITSAEYTGRTKDVHRRFFRGGWSPVGAFVASSRVMTALIGPSADPDSASHVLLDVSGPQYPGVQEDADEQDEHEDERERRRDRVVEVLQVLQLDDVADHRGVGASQDRRINVVADRRHEREEDPGEHSRDG